jgi:glyoxylase-like metal-dependent hydrolase (beta-lactamase superfamily II)
MPPPHTSPRPSGEDDFADLVAKTENKRRDAASTLSGEDNIANPIANTGNNRRDAASTLPIEDDFTDLIAKAARGLGVGDETLVQLAGITPGQLLAVKSGLVDAPALHALAVVLELNPEALIALARREWYPHAEPPGDGFAMFTTPFARALTVNNYLLWDPATHEAALFDTGTNADAALDLIRARALHVRDIYITHTHHDHIQALAPLSAATGATVHTPAREPLNGALPISANDQFALGHLTITALPAHGHSPGQTAFYVSGLSCPLIIVGDALFAGSMGGSTDFYREQRRLSRQNILGLPGHTVIAPGHGPLTTVDFEKRHNPVFSETPPATA